MGRLTADPELRQTQNGTAVCRFTVAVNRRTQDKSADFISCTAWGKTAEFIDKYFTKGQMIAVTGELRTGSYQDKKYPDVTHYTAEVWVESAEFTGSKPQNSTVEYFGLHY
ncbi:MAG: single-stranded DNA-binding protein [Ruminococcus flavefaciens]|nr:single-stranded DNA-binding protein [Ruminococcus flavefaciens]